MLQATTTAPYTQKHGFFNTALLGAVLLKAAKEKQHIMVCGAGGRTPGTALHGNARTPVSGGRSSSSGTGGRAGQNPLNTVAAATTRPSRFMQAAARGNQVPADDSPAARAGAGPPMSSSHAPPRGGQLTCLSPWGMFASGLLLYTERHLETLRPAAVQTQVNVQGSWTSVSVRLLTHDERSQ